MEQAADLEIHLVESLNSIKTVMHFGLEDFANIKPETHFILLHKTTYRSAINSIFYGTSSQTLAQLFTIVFLWVGSGFVMQQEITIGELLSFYAIIGNFTGSISRLVSANVQIQQALIAADNLFEIMDLESEEEEQSINPVVQSTVGRYSF